MSKFDQLLKKTIDPTYMSQAEWGVLTPEQRVAHANRSLPSNCAPAKFENWPDERLHEAYSFDPYAHTAHMDKCQRPEKTIDECTCQMCVRKIGIEC